MQRGRPRSLWFPGGLLGWEGVRRAQLVSSAGCPPGADTRGRSLPRPRAARACGPERGQSTPRNALVGTPQLGRGRREGQGTLPVGPSAAAGKSRARWTRVSQSALGRGFPASAWCR